MRPRTSFLAWTSAPFSTRRSSSGIRFFHAAKCSEVNPYALEAVGSWKDGKPGRRRCVLGRRASMRVRVCVRVRGGTARAWHGLQRPHEAAGAERTFLSLASMLAPIAWSVSMKR